MFTNKDGIERTLTASDQNNIVEHDIAYTVTDPYGQRPPIYIIGTIHEGVFAYPTYNNFYKLFCDKKIEAVYYEVPVQEMIAHHLWKNGRLQQPSLTMCFAQPFYSINCYLSAGQVNRHETSIDTYQYDGAEQHLWNALGYQSSNVQERSLIPKSSCKKNITFKSLESSDYHLALSTCANQSLGWMIKPWLKSLIKKEPMLAQAMVIALSLSMSLLIRDAIVNKIKLMTGLEYATCAILLMMKTFIKQLDPKNPQRLWQERLYNAYDRMKFVELNIDDYDVANNQLDLEERNQTWVAETIIPTLKDEKRKTPVLFAFGCAHLHSPNKTKGVLDLLEQSGYQITAVGLA